MSRTHAHRKGRVFAGIDYGRDTGRTSTRDWTSVEDACLVLFQHPVLSVEDFLDSYDMPMCVHGHQGVELRLDPRVAVDSPDDVHPRVAVVVLVVEELTLVGRHVPDELLAAASLALASGAAWIARKP